MKHISLYYSVFLFPRDTHLEEWVFFLEYHCNGSICLREWMSFSYMEFIFSRVLLKQLTVVQSAEFLALWFVIKLREKGSGFFTTLNDNCPLKRAGQLCMYGDNRRAWIAILGCLLSFWSHFKQPLVSGINRSKLAKCIDPSPKFRRSKNFYLLFYYIFWHHV